MIPELRDDIDTKALTMDGLSSSNFSYKRAKKETQFLYVVFSEVSNPEAGGDTETRHEEVYFQFNVYSKDQDAAEAMAAKIRTEFDDSETDFSLTDYNMIEIKWMLTRDGMINEVNQITIQYKILLTTK